MTPDEINALPERVRRYIHDLATRCDPAGEIAELTLTRDQNAHLQTLVEVLRHEKRALELALGEAAGEIFCSGPVAHRIRVLKGHHTEQVTRLEKHMNMLEAALTEAAALTKNYPGWSSARMAHDACAQALETPYVSVSSGDPQGYLESGS